MHKVDSEPNLPYGILPENDTNERYALVARLPSGATARPQSGQRSVEALTRLAVVAAYARWSRLEWEEVLAFDGHIQLAWR